VACPPYLVSTCLLESAVAPPPPVLSLNPPCVTPVSDAVSISGSSTMPSPRSVVVDVAVPLPEPEGGKPGEVGVIAIPTMCSPHAAAHVSLFRHGLLCP
jgi:hypothetical protein